MATMCSTSQTEYTTNSPSCFALAYSSLLTLLNGSLGADAPRAAPPKDNTTERTIVIKPKGLEVLWTIDAPPLFCKRWMTHITGKPVYLSREKRFASPFLSQPSSRNSCTHSDRSC